MPLCCCHCDKINVRVGFSRPRGLGFSLVLVWVWARVWGSCPHTGSDTQAGRIFYICAPCVCAPGTAIVNSSCLFLLSKRICHVRAERRGRIKKTGGKTRILCVYVLEQSAQDMPCLWFAPPSGRRHTVRIRNA